LHDVFKFSLQTFGYEILATELWLGQSKGKLGNGKVDCWSVGAKSGFAGYGRETAHLEERGLVFCVHKLGILFCVHVS
jgi:hypothetical protein